MVGCSALHIVGAATTASSDGLHVLAMIGMAVVCLPCAVHVVVMPGRAVWFRAVLLSGGMLAAHALMTITPGHVHTGAPEVVSVGTIVGPALTLVISAWGVRSSAECK
jgi:hypothetical protein